MMILHLAFEKLKSKAFVPIIGLGLLVFHCLVASEAPLWLLGAGMSVPLAAVLGRELQGSQGVGSRLDGVANFFCDSAVTALATALAAYDRRIYLHCRRVQILSLLLAKRCGLRDRRSLEALRVASLLHDLGKMAVRGAVLNKPSALSLQEMNEIRAHSGVGADIVCKLPFDGPVVEWIRLHHERWDGSGYPFGLKGEQIPLEVRILAVADCYDALRSERPYRGRYSREEAVRLLSGDQGKAFDPSVLDLLMSDLDEVEELLKRLRPESRIDEARTA